MSIPLSKGCHQRNYAVNKKGGKEEKRAQREKERMGIVMEPVKPCELPTDQVIVIIISSLSLVLWAKRRAIVLNV